MTDSPTSTNHASHKKPRARKRVVEWPDVLRVIQADQTRSLVLGQFKDSGFNADSWSSRWAREKMAGLLTAAEDRHELERGPSRAAERQAISVVRRRLELELWS